MHLLKHFLRKSINGSAFGVGNKFQTFAVRSTCFSRSFQSAAPVDRSFAVVATPNPRARLFRFNGVSPFTEAGTTFTSDSERSASKVETAVDAAAACSHEQRLANRLLGVLGVARVYLQGSNATVTLAETAEWKTAEAELRTIIEQFAESDGAMDVPSAMAKGGDESETADLEDETREMINMRVKPFVQQDGGNIEVMRFDKGTGVVYVHLSGSCAGCPSSDVTMQIGAKAMLRHYFPEVSDVRRCDENGEPLEADD